MITSTFSPYQQLSDSIVGEVVQRSGSRRSGQVVADDYLFATTDSNSVTTSSQVLIARQVGSDVASPYTNHFVPTTGKTNLYSKPTTKFAMACGHHVFSAENSHQAIISQQENVWRRQHQMNTIHQNNLDVVDVLTQHQREQRRNSQQRYRRKKRQIVVSLEQDVQRLRLQILKHELERRILGSRPPTSVTPWIVVSEYYRLFRNGLKRPQTPAPSSVSKPTSYERDGTQINFLREVMSPDVSVNSGFGVDALIQEWSAVPLMYQDIAVHLVRLEYDGAHTILATIKACITITEEMLRWEFPYFVDRSQDHQTSRLMTKLVGQQLVIPTTARFEWDPIERRVLSVHYSSDLVTPFLKILGNIRDAAIVLDNSLLSLAMIS